MFLEQQADPQCAFALAEETKVRPAYAHGAAHRRSQAGQRMQSQRLADAVGSQHGNQCAGPQLETEFPDEHAVRYRNFQSLGFQQHGHGGIVGAPAAPGSKKTPQRLRGLTRVIVVVANSVSVSAAPWWCFSYCSLMRCFYFCLFFFFLLLCVFWLRCLISDVEHCYRW